MTAVYTELKAGQSVLVTKSGSIEWVSSIDYVYNVAKTKLLSSRPKDRYYNCYWNVFSNRFSVHGARVVEFDKEELERIRADLRMLIYAVKSIVESLEEVFVVYTGNYIPELLEKHSEKLPELRSEFKVMILAALEDNKKIKLHTSEQANRMHKKDFVYLMLEPGSTKASIDEDLKNWKLVS